MFNIFKKKTNNVFDYCKKEFGGDIYKISISLPEETWGTLDMFIDMHRRTTLELKWVEITPAIYGWILVSGLIKLRKRLRLKGSFVNTMTQLLKELDNYEHRSQKFILWPKSTNVNRLTRELDMLINENVYNIIETISMGMVELSSNLTKERAIGLFMIFGLWELKEIYLSCNDLIKSTKVLLENNLASGECD